jgi:YegS/Rv2252/BmrU family lipid kinase
MVVQIIVNGSKPRACRYAKQLLLCLKDLHAADMLITRHRGHARSLARSSAKVSDVIICIGGDGTISECASGIADAIQESEALPSCKLLPVAFGTGNDFLRNFHFANSIQGVESRLQNLSVHLCDLFVLSDDAGNVRYFINECSAGLGPAVVRNAEKIPSLIRGSLRFHLAILWTFLRYANERISIRADEFTYESNALALICANGKYFGGGIGIAPDAKPDDGLLNVTIIGNVGLTEYLKHLPALKRGEKINHPEVRYLQCSQASLQSNALETDGEFVAGNEFRVSRFQYQLMIV